MVAALNSLSDNCNSYHFGVGVYELPFFIQLEISLGFDMASYFLLKHGHLGYYASYETLDLFKPFVLADFLYLVPERHYEGGEHHLSAVR